jgi:hypothetical protein
MAIAVGRRLTLPPRPRRVGNRREFLEEPLLHGRIVADSTDERDELPQRGVAHLDRERGVADL